MSKYKFQNVTGMPDILPKEERLFALVEKTCSKLASYYSYEKIETPILEYSELFEKGTGAGSDIVQKQMYNLTTEGEDKLTLRPEFTPSIVRAYIQHGMISWPQPVKFSAYGPVFRHERPQAGRFREFRQFEIDALGDQDPILDVQIIFIIFKILNTLGIKDVVIQINSIGCAKCRPNYNKVLRDYYRGRGRSLCKDCRIRQKVSVLRVLDCKDEKCERVKIGAPEIVDRLCVECRNHLKHVLEIADYLDLPYMLFPHLVRGLDYYTKTVFEIFTQEAKKEGECPVALAAGGRFDGLVKILGGEETPAVGGSLGVERTVAYMHKLGLDVSTAKAPKVFFTHLGDLAKKRGIKLLEELRSAGIPIKEMLGKSSIKAQMALADKLGVDYVLILGQQEVGDETIIIRDMRSGSQEVVPMAKIIKELKKRI